MNLNKQFGVTLVEMIMLIVVMAVISIPFSNAILQVSSSNIRNTELTQATGLARECAEFILQQRRANLINSGVPVTANTCDDPVIPGFTSPQETITVAPLDAAGTGNCPTGSAGCSEVNIAIFDTSASRQSANLFLYIIY